MKADIGVGAGKFWGLRRIFVWISTNLPDKFFCYYLCEYFFMKTVFQMASKIKGVHVILGAIFFKSKHLGALFAHIFREFALIDLLLTVNSEKQD